MKNLPSYVLWTIGTFGAFETVHGRCMFGSICRATHMVERAVPFKAMVSMATVSSFPWRTYRAVSLSMRPMPAILMHVTKLVLEGPSTTEVFLDQPWDLRALVHLKELRLYAHCTRAIQCPSHAMDLLVASYASAQRITGGAFRCHREPASKHDASPYTAIPDFTWITPQLENGAITHATDTWLKNNNLLPVENHQASLRELEALSLPTGVFPALKRLIILGRQVNGWPDFAACVPNVAELHLRTTARDATGLTSLAHLTKLHLVVDTMECQVWPPALETLQIHHYRAMRPCVYPATLKSLTLSCAGNLVNFPMHPLPTTLHVLVLIRYVVGMSLASLVQLENLSLLHCKLYSPGFSYPPCIKTLQIDNCTTHEDFVVSIPQTLVTLWERCALHIPDSWEPDGLGHALDRYDLRLENESPMGYTLDSLRDRLLRQTHQPRQRILHLPQPDIDELCTSTTLAVVLDFATTIILFNNAILKPHCDGSITYCDVQRGVVEHFPNVLKSAMALLRLKAYIRLAIRKS